MRHNELDKFLNLEISKETLSNMVGGNPIYQKADPSLQVKAENVIKMLHYFQTDRITLEEAIAWCDIIRFSDLYDYPDETEEQEAIATVIDEFQDIKTCNEPISTEKISRWRSVLEMK